MNADNSMEFEYLHKRFEVETKSSNSFISYFLALIAAVVPNGAISATLSSIPTPLQNWAILVATVSFAVVIYLIHREEARSYVLRHQMYARLRFVTAPKPRFIEEFILIVPVTCLASLSAITAYAQSVKLQEIGVGLEKPELSPESLITMAIISFVLSFIFALFLLFDSIRLTRNVTP
jgi:hypothetical protein